MSKLKIDDPQYSPKLKMAHKEIEDILKKYDIAGVVQLFEPGFNEYAIHIAPSWSAVSINEVGQLKITPPIVDPLNEEPAKKKIADTVNMVANMRVYVGKLAAVLMQADVAVRTHFGMMPKAPDFKPGGPNVNGANPYQNGRKK